MKVAIIGAGPAGLTFANTLSSVYDNDNYTIVDMGKPVRKREPEHEGERTPVSRKKRQE